MLSQHVWEQLAAARYGLLRLEEFEQWIYDATDLETVLRGDDYLALLSFSFRQPHVQYELSRLVDALYKRNRPALQSRDLGAWLARAFLRRELDLVTICRMFARLWNAGETSVPTRFVYVDSELDSIPMPAQYALWDPGALAARRAEARPLLESCERTAREAAEQLLSGLDSDGSARTVQGR